MNVIFVIEKSYKHGMKIITDTLLVRNFMKRNNFPNCGLRSSSIVEEALVDFYQYCKMSNKLSPNGQWEEVQLEIVDFRNIRLGSCR